MSEALEFILLSAASFCVWGEIENWKERKKNFIWINQMEGFMKGLKHRVDQLEEQIKHILETDLKNKAKDLGLDEFIKEKDKK